MKKNNYLLLAFIILLSPELRAQHDHHHDHTNIEVQPLLSQAMRLKEALNFLGSSLSPEDEKRLNELQHTAYNEQTIHQVQEILDPYCIAIVNINPEGRVKVERGAAKNKLMQGGWTSFLVKVQNNAGITAALNVESPNSKSRQHFPSFDPKVHDKNIITEGQVSNRFMDMQMYRNKPMMESLSGLKLEYAVVQLYSSDAGKREVEIGFNVGQGSQDIGFRNAIHILFDIKPSVKVMLDIKDDDGTPAMASFVFTDSIERVPGKLSGVYPLPSRRVAAYDEYPDFFFQKQIYRSNGEHVRLAPGKYHVTYTRGPEYLPQTTDIEIPEGKDSVSLSFKLKRWIKLSKLGWYSADHHVHAAGCSHYDSPEEGVRPKDMYRQMLGEDLNFAAVLTWGPSWYHQKQYFTGKDDPLSTKKNIMRYDVEISGFPSSHSGHVVLLGIKEDDYPGTTKLEDWPSWTLPILKWARAQGGIVGYAHSAWGLGPMEPVYNKLPNYVTPRMDNIGANEYIVTIAHDAIDFYSLGDTPPVPELNMWYHTLNAGFRPRISGETDYPCITDDRVGQARSYFKAPSITYDSYMDAIKTGRSYVSDGGSHIMNFAVNGQEVGTKQSLIKTKGKQKVNITADVAAYLPEKQTDFFKNLQKSESVDGYFWNIEIARVGSSRKIGVELIVNGYPVDTVELTADGKINKVKFEHVIDHSSWVALRVYASSHTNPIFIEADEKPIREVRSIEWCIKALDQCWKQKEPNIRAEEKAAAKTAYDEARTIYQNMLK